MSKGSPERKELVRQWIIEGKQSMKLFEFTKIAFSPVYYQIVHPLSPPTIEKVSE